MHQEHQWHFLISCRSTKSYLLLQLLLSFAGNRTPQEAHSYGKTSCVELDHSSIKKKPSGDITRPIPYKCFLMKMEFVTVSIFFIMGKSIIFYWSLKKKKSYQIFSILWPFCQSLRSHTWLCYSLNGNRYHVGTFHTRGLIVLMHFTNWRIDSKEVITVLLFCICILCLKTL